MQYYLVQVVCLGQFIGATMDFLEIRNSKLHSLKTGLFTTTPSSRGKLARVHQTNPLSSASLRDKLRTIITSHRFQQLIVAKDRQPHLALQYFTIFMPSVILMVFYLFIYFFFFSSH